MEERKGPDPVRRDLVYRWLNGYIGREREKDSLTDEQMQIAFLAEQIYQRRLNLHTRVNLNFEDRDMEAIIDAYERLNRLCADFMYNQGWLDGTLAAQE